VCVAALAWPSIASAQEESGEPDAEGRPRWTLQVDPLTTYLGYVHVQVERALGDHVSVYAGPHFRLFSPPTAAPEDYLGLGVELGARVFPWGEAPRGPWAQVRGVGARLWSGEDTAWGGYVSGLVGYTWILGDVFVLSGGAGVQYLNYRINDLGPRGVFPALHTTLGVAF
jgi:hypothetical protein